MQNLYWKSKTDSRNLIPKPFTSENEFESYVFNNQDLLGDVFILTRQIRTGNKQGIPDMLGVDQDSRICVIEMKNVEVNEEIFPQLLQYAMWAENNPDSIRAIWLEAKNRPEEVKIDWDSLTIRVIVIAPAYRGNVIKMTDKISYEVDLLQIQRFFFEENEFILVESLEKPTMIKPKTTKVMGDWSWDYYESEHGKEPTQEFRKAVDQLAAFVKKQGWNLEYNLNKNYTGFKFGNKVVFDVGWESIKTWSVRMKLPLEIAKTFEGKKWNFHNYDAPFKNACYRINVGNEIDIMELQEMLILAYKNISGTK